MKHLRRVSERGMTLLEVMVAISIFAIVIGVTATSLGSFYVTMDVQKERIAAVQSCRSVMGAIREKRAEFVLPTEEFNREAFLQWVSQSNEDGWQDFLHLGPAGLLNHQLVVSCFNTNGQPATAEDTPIRLHVTASWQDRSGRLMNAQIISVLADQ